MNTYRNFRRELSAGATLPVNGWAIVWNAPSFDEARAELRAIITTKSWPYALKKTLPEAVRTARYLTFSGALTVAGHTHRPRVFWVGERP